MLGSRKCRKTDDRDGNGAPHIVHLVARASLLVVAPFLEAPVAPEVVVVAAAVAVAAVLTVAVAAVVDVTNVTTVAAVVVVDVVGADAKRTFGTVVVAFPQESRVIFYFVLSDLPLPPPCLF